MSNPFHVPSKDEVERRRDHSPPPQHTDPAPEPPRPDELKRLSSRTTLTATLMLATLLTSMMPLPLRATAIIFGLWGTVAAVRTIQLGSTLQTPKGQQIPVWVGAGLSIFLALSVALSLTRWDIEMAYQTCHNEAVTNQATRACDREYEDALTERYGQSLLSRPSSTN